MAERRVLHPTPGDSWTEATYDATPVDPAVFPEFTPEVRERIWHKVQAVLVGRGRAAVTGLAVGRGVAPSPGVPDDNERVRLTHGFGATLRRERGMWTQQQLADAAKLHRVTIAWLEEGRQRPTAASVWKIARALRTDLQSRVALDERLRRAAGPSFRDYGRRPHRAREAMRTALVVEQGSGPVFGAEDTLGTAIVAHLDALARGGEL